jgi:hypothetical protein
MPCRARSRSSRDCLVVTELAIAKSQVVHAALTRCTGAEGFQDYVRDTLRGQYVASHYCSLRRRIKETIFGYNSCDGIKTSLIQGYISID